jgi:hypothetical protein
MRHESRKDFVQAGTLKAMTSAQKVVSIIVACGLTALVVIIPYVV